MKPRHRKALNLGGVVTLLGAIVALATTLVELRGKMIDQDRARGVQVRDLRRELARVNFKVDSLGKKVAFLGRLRGSRATGSAGARDATHWVGPEMPPSPGPVELLGRVAIAPARWLAGAFRYVTGR